MVSKVPVRSQKTAAREGFFCEAKEWVYGYSLGPLGSGFKKKRFTLYLGKIPILTNMFQLGGDHQLTRWIFLRNVEVG